MTFERFVYFILAVNFAYSMHQGNISAALWVAGYTLAYYMYGVQQAKAQYYLTALTEFVKTGEELTAAYERAVKKARKE